MKSQKIVLEIYGIFRICLGVAQMVGVFSGYFLLEWILKYPSSSAGFIIREETVALVCLAVLFRGVFHLLAGIALARLASWTKTLFIIGWPLMGLVTLGLAVNLSGLWHAQGYVSGGLGSIISFLKLIVYLLWIVFDFTFVLQNIGAVNREEEPVLSSSHVTAIFIIAAVFFFGLLFFARPVRKGFHEGYYKIRGKAASSGQATSRKISFSTRERIEKTGVKSQKTFIEEPAVAVVVSRQPAGSGVSGVKRSAVTKDLSLKKLLGFLGSLCLVLAFIGKTADAVKARSPRFLPVAAVSILGCVFLIVYALSLKLGAVLLLSGCLLVVEFFAVGIYFKKSDQ